MAAFPVEPLIDCVRVKAPNVLLADVAVAQVVADRLGITLVWRAVSAAPAGSQLDPGALGHRDARLLAQRVFLPVRKDKPHRVRAPLASSGETPGRGPLALDRRGEPGILECAEDQVNAE